MSKITFCVCSKSKTKADVAKLIVNEVASYFNLVNATLQSVEAESGVNEQPVGRDEIVGGAINRIKSARLQVKADAYISIENGLIKHGESWFDYGYVRIFYLNPVTRKVSIHTGLSEKCEFPAKYVKIAYQRGFDTTTVGSVLAEYGVVENGKYPHLSLSGISRFDYLAPAARKAALSLIQEMDS